MVRFGLFEADIKLGELRKQGLLLKLQGQPFQILALLLERPGEIVSRKKIQQKLWPDNTFVEFDNGLNVAVKKLRDALCDDADNPRFIETVPRQGYRFIAPVLESTKDIPEAAVPHAISAGPAALASAASGIGSMERHGGMRARRMPSWPLAVFAVIAVLLAVGGYRWFVPAKFHKAVDPTPVASAAPRRGVAVLAFRNASGREDSTWLSTALSEMLSTELAAGNQLRLVSGEEVTHLHLTNPWSPSDSLGQETTARVGSTLGSDFIVVGSYVSLSGSGNKKLRVDARLQEASTGHILAEVAETGSEQDLFSLVARVGGRLRQQLGVPVISDDQAASVRASISSNPEAQRFYSLGLAKLREYDALTARDLLLRAVQGDPKFALAHFRLSSAWLTLGYDKEAHAEIKKAFDLSEGLPPPEKLLVEGRYWEDIPDWEKAASVYRALFALFPDSVEDGLLLTNAQSRIGQSSAALETIASLRKFPPQVSEDPRLDLAEAGIWGIKDKERALQILRQAITKAQVQGLKLLYARAKQEECIDLEWSSHPQEAVAACEEAKQIFLAAGDRRQAAISTRAIADRRSDEGQREEALRLYKEALVIFSEIGERANTAAVLNNMGLILESQGNLDEAEKMFQEAAHNFREVQEQTNLAVAVGNLADIRMQKGDIRGAKQLQEKRLELTRSTGDEGVVGEALNGLAGVKLLTGNVEEARALAEESIRLNRKVGNAGPLSESLSGLGDILLAEGDLAGARQNYDEALTLRQKINAPDAAAAAKMSLADVGIEEGHASDAQRLLREALLEFQAEKDQANTSSAQIELGRALLLDGKLDEAMRAYDEAIRVSGPTRDPNIKLRLMILHSRLLGQAAVSNSQRNQGQKNLAAARQQLQLALAEARKTGLYGLECEARLALGEMEVKRNASLGRANLVELEKSARTRGFELLARKASNLLRQNQVSHQN